MTDTPETAAGDWVADAKKRQAHEADHRRVRDCQRLLPARGDPAPARKG